ncbi:MAG TPA: Stk1 family PASTA domain-containing Ser/Thr kinase [Nocardioides sp.]|nr:Stk1 family PASTA domain-containing Ser/Thr kinase [Nocardioides sp.]
MTGQLIGGRYELGEMLGRGGMAEVRKGTDSRLGRVVAVKRLRTDLASDATFQARFRREAQSSASLNHPAIVAVYDTGEETAGDGSGVAQPYIVMEYVAGRTLRDIIREGRKILPERALEITSGVLSALDYSHRAGIIHRDIKPGNVMLTPSGDVKVMDFGIARAISDASSTMTQTAAVVGTAQYLSPEQARGETVDSRSDVYSAGCLLYELLTGRPPFVGDSPVAVAYQHVREPATPPSQHDDELPEEIDAIVMKALAKRVEDRYQSAAAMRNDIERYLAGRPVQAVVPPPPPPTTSIPASATAVGAPLPDEEEDDTRSRKVLYVLLGLLLLGLIAAAAYLLPQMFESPPQQVRVPDLIGLTETEARAEIGNAGFAVGDVEFREDEDVRANRVIEQDPNRDTFADPGTEIDLVVSSGKPLVEVPFVVGRPRSAAASALREANLEVSMQERDSDEPAGRVLSTDPRPGDSVPEGTLVTVFYSDGPEEVPGVVGLQRPEAEQIIRDAGFEPDVVEDPNSRQPRGTVIRQSPAAGQDAPEGSTVTIVVSAFERPTRSPSPSPSPTPTEPPPETTPPPDETVPPTESPAVQRRLTGTRDQRSGSA